MKAPKRVLAVFAIALALALAFFVIPAITDSGQKASAEWPYTLIYYDGHMHSKYSDGSGTVDQIKATALARGLKAVIITDHCEDLAPGEWESLVADTARVSDGSFLALPAFENTGSEGLFMRDHMLAYNVANPFINGLCPSAVWPSPLNPAGTGANAVSLAKWAEWIRSQGGIAVHAHPTGSTQLSYGVNDIEVYNQEFINSVIGFAAQLGIPYQQAWQFAMTINNFAPYGERDLMTMVQFPGFPVQVPLRYALYVATQMLTGVGQIIGWGDFNPSHPGDLNSWDELLMAYVNGTVDKPIFAVADSDSHNTGASDSTVGLAKNGLYVLALTPKQVYKAIEAGRSFATTGPSLAFDVNGSLMGSTAYIPRGWSAHLNLSAKAETPGYVVAKIDVYKNGQLWKTIPVGGPSYVATLTDAMTARGYYRVEVTSVPASGPGLPQFAYSNPVFVKCPFDKDCDGYLDFIETLLGSNPDDAGSTPESIFVPGTCRDGLDNDGDGLIDAADPGCSWRS